MADRLSFTAPPANAPVAMPLGANFGQGVVESVPLGKIHPFPNHPFLVVENADLQQLADSIRDHGVQEPVMLRPTDNYQYQLLSGHRRCRAAELAGLRCVPAIVRQMTDDEATIYMVDANLHRPHILPSEKAKSYRMKMDALRHQGKHIGGEASESWSANQIAQDTGESSRQVYRYVRLSNLIDRFLEMIDNNDQKVKPNPSDLIFTMPMNVGLTLADLTEEQQYLLFDCICKVGKAPTLSQAIGLHESAKSNTLSADCISSVLNEKVETSRHKSKEKSAPTPENTESESVSELCDTVSQSDCMANSAVPLRQLRNKEERAAFLEAYAQWGIWKEIPELRVRFYKYDLPNGARIVAQTYVHPPIRYLSSHQEEYTVAEYALLLPKEEDYRGEFGQEYSFYRPNGASKSAIIDYLTKKKPQVHFEPECGSED